MKYTNSVSWAVIKHRKESNSNMICLSFTILKTKLIQFKQED